MRGFRRFLALTAAASLVMLLAGSMVSEAHAYRGEGRGHMGRLFKGLNLTAEQKQQIKGIVQIHRSDLIAGKIAVLQARQNLTTVTTGGTYDKSAVDSAFSSLAAAQEKMTELRAEIFSAVIQVLSPDQQTAVKEKIAKRNQHMQEAIDRLQSKLSPLPQSNQ